MGLTVAANMRDVVVAAGTAVRLEADCPSCGWADLWSFPVHSLAAHGVGLVATVIRCARCGQRQTERYR